MIQSVTRLARVVDNLSDFASLQAGESPILAGPVNPDQLADDVVAELRPMIKDARLNVTVAHEQDLYEHRLIRMDAIKDDAGGVSAALGEALGAQLPVPPSSGARRFPEGHWRHYAAALSGPFAALTPVAVRLGYPEA